MKTFGIVVLVVILVVTLSVIHSCTSYVGKAATVVSNEIDPQVLQSKYEWFKDAYSQLQADKANINVTSGKIKSLPKQGLDRTDREQLMIWEQELAGYKGAYNDLASQYNAEMAKWNWRFTNIGDLPKGETEPLPRNVAPYVEE